VAEEGVYSEEGDAVDTITEVAASRGEGSANNPAGPGYDFGRLMVSPYRVVGQMGVEFDTYFYHTDHLGTPRLITDPAGNVVTYHKYDPFGEELQPLQSPNTHQFTGHERDQATGLDYMLARYYSVSLARFVSPDPGFQEPTLLRPQSWNQYAYARNNPLRFSDQSGLVSREQIKASIRWAQANALADPGYNPNRWVSSKLDSAASGGDQHTILGQIASKGGLSPVAGIIYLGDIATLGTRSPEESINRIGTLTALRTHELGDQGRAALDILRTVSTSNALKETLTPELGVALFKGAVENGQDRDAAIGAIKEAFSLGDDQLRIIDKETGKELESAGDSEIIEVRITFKNGTKTTITIEKSQ
jgi:RHS repeat-associated protein